MAKPDRLKPVLPKPADKTRRSEQEFQD